MEVGYMPVMMDDRHGAQTPATTVAFVYRTPWVASRSTLGVVALAYP
jgi:hypothetical protein